MINIEARKKSLDPKQEELREKKSLWNKEVSVFIDNLINFKKMVNGSPSKFNMERSKITDPLPKDPVSILTLLAGKFDDIASKGNDIISNQITYSQTRKKKQVKPTSPDLTKQLLSSIDSDMMVVTASNVLSRFLSYVKPPWFGDAKKQKKIRLSLIASLLYLSKLCSKFQLEIVGSGKNNIDNSNKILIQIEDSLLQISNSLGIFSETFGLKPKSKEIDVSDIKNKLQDFNKNILNFPEIEPDSIYKMRELQKGFVAEENIEQKSEIADNIVELYKKILNSVGSQRGVTGTSLSEILEATTQKKEANLNVIAQSFIKKWLGKTKHKINPWDKTSSLRLVAYDESEKMNDILDEMMNSLQKEFDLNYLSNNMQTLFDSFSIIRKVVDTLLPDVYTDISSYTGKQKEQLEKIIHQRRIREMARKLSK